MSGQIYRTGPRKEYLEKKAAEEEQARLREKYNVPEQGTVVVEKSNMVKFTVRGLAAVLRFVRDIAICLLALIGIVSLAYEAPRMALLSILKNAMDTVFK